MPARGMYDAIPENMSWEARRALTYMNVPFAHACTRPMACFGRSGGNRKAGFYGPLSAALTIPVTATYVKPAARSMAG